MTALPAALHGFLDAVVALLREGCLRLTAMTQQRRETQRDRRLRVIETVGLGEKRFVAILQVRQVQYLIGGGPTGVSLLARLDIEAPVDGAQQASPKAPHAESTFADAVARAGASNSHVQAC